MKNKIPVKGKTRSIQDLHFELQLWLSEAGFYADELKIYQKRVEELASKNTKNDIYEQLEFYRKQFIIEQQQLERVNKKVKIIEHWLAKISDRNIKYLGLRLFIIDKRMKSEVEGFKKLYTQLKKEFTVFVANRM